MPRKLISFDWAIKRILRSKANFDILEEALDYLKMSEEEKIQYKRYQEDKHHEASIYESTYVVGRLEASKAIARNLLDVLDLETIALKTGLSIEEVQKLSNQQVK